MAKFELDAGQANEVEQAFLAMPMQDGVKENLDQANERMFQTAKFMHTLSRKCPEQQVALRKLQEALHWYSTAIVKYGKR